MRIVSGVKKGKRIIAPKNLPTRPTTDFAKENLFNILNNRFHFDGLNVLDLFAGTGNISYEFASRGAGLITSVDNNYGCTKFIEKTADDLGFDQIIAVKHDAFKWLKMDNKKYDIIFCDPPYELLGIEEIPNLVFEKSLLAPESLLIVEHSRDTRFEEHPQFNELKKYSSVNFSFFKEE